MGRSSSSGSSRNGGGNRNPSTPTYGPPSIQTKAENKKRYDYMVDRTVQAVTKKQIGDPTRMQGGADHKTVWNSVAMRKGNYVTNKRGIPLRTSSGSIVMTSKGQREFDKTMKRIPTSKAQRESQSKLMSIISLPLFLVPGGSLIRKATLNRMNDPNRIFTYGGGELPPEQVAEIRAQQAEKGAPPGTKVERKVTKKKSFIDYAFGPKLSVNQTLGATGGKF